MRCLFTAMSIAAVAAACGSTESSSSDAGEVETVDSSMAAVDMFTGSEQLAAGQHEMSLEHDGEQRTYTLIVPDGDEHPGARPLLVNMHGYTSNMMQQQSYMAPDPVARDAGYVLVFPQGLFNSWNAATCCGNGRSADVDDVGFIRALIAEVQDRTWVNPRRIYATGMSNGGMMSHRLGCEASDLIAAIAPVAGASMPGAGGACMTGRGVPVLHFHGRADDVAPYATVPGPIAEWRRLNGCEGAPEVTYDEGDTVCETYADCDDGVEVTLCSSEGAGHCWPGITFCTFGAAATGISANEAMVTFFEKYELQP